MKNYYDIIFLTNTPSFYKLNLCREIAKTHQLLIVFAGYDDKAVNTILNDSHKVNFDFCFLNEGDYESRSKLKVLSRLFKLMRQVSSRRILYSGWMAMEYNLISFFFSKNKNVIICESSSFDTNLKGLKGLIKRLIISRMSAALPSGEPHSDLFKGINFKGALNTTGSVGIFNKGNRKLKQVKPTIPLRYLYVGRLVDVKNLRFLVDIFNQNGNELTIVGDGKMRAELEAKASANIKFLGFKPNSELGHIYEAHDVFILPSYYEPWGLVVEEALYWGLPVIVSDRVGCSIDMVEDLGTGAIFESNNADALNHAIVDVEQNYDKYLSAVNAIDWEERDRNQVRAYTSLLDN